MPPEDELPTCVRSATREMGPFYAKSRAEREAFVEQMLTYGHYNGALKDLGHLHIEAVFLIENGVFIIPTIRFITDKSCTIIVKSHFVEIDEKALMRKDPRIAAIAAVKAQLRTDLLSALNANLCQEIETRMFKEVDRLHADYESTQRERDAERMRKKREKKERRAKWDDERSKPSLDNEEGQAANNEEKEDDEQRQQQRQESRQPIKSDTFDYADVSAMFGRGTRRVDYYEDSDSSSDTGDSDWGEKHTVRRERREPKQKGTSSFFNKSSSLNCLI